MSGFRRPEGSILDFDRPTKQKLLPIGPEAAKSGMKPAIKLGIGLLTVLLVALAGGLLYVTQVKLPEGKARKTFEQGTAALRDNRFTDALAAFEEAFELDPGHPRAGFALFDGWAYLDPEKCAWVLDSLETEPVSREGLLARRIRLSLIRDELEAARSAGEQLRELDRTGLRGGHALALLLLAEGNFAEGRDRVFSLAGTYPDDRNLEFLEGVLLASRDSAVDRVRGKQLLLGLLDRVDAVSLQACLHLAGPDQLNLFESEWDRVLDHLEQHPFTGRGLEKLETNVLRASALRLAPVAPEIAFLFSGNLVNRPDSVPDDAVLHVETAIDLDRKNEVRNLLQSIARKADRSVNEELLLAKEDFLEDNPAGGLERIDRVLAEDPANPAAYRILTTVIERGIGDLTDSQKLRVYSNLIEHPSGTLEAKLRAYSGMMEMNPLRRDALVGEAIGRFAESDPLPLAAWLNSIGESERVLGLIPEDEAVSDMDRLSVRYEALKNLERHAEMESLVRNGESLLEPLRSALLLAQVKTLQGDPAAAREQLANGIELAQRSSTPDVYLALAELAVTAGADDLQRTAYDHAYARGTVFPDSHAVRYVHSLMNAGELDKARAFALYCRNLAPQNPILINNDCYLQAIMEENLEDCISDMREVVAAFPEVPTFRGTLALAEMLGDQPEAAMETLENRDLPMKLESPQERMIFALVLAGNGQHGVARTVVKPGDMEALMPIERALLERFLNLSRNP